MTSSCIFHFIGYEGTTGVLVHMGTCTHHHCQNLGKVHPTLGKLLGAGNKRASLNYPVKPSGFMQKNRIFHSKLYLTSDILPNTT